MSDMRSEMRDKARHYDYTDSPVSGQDVSQFLYSLLVKYPPVYEADLRATIAAEIDAAHLAHLDRLVDGEFFGRAIGADEACNLAAAIAEGKEL